MDWIDEKKSIFENKDLVETNHFVYRNISINKSFKKQKVIDNISFKASDKFPFDVGKDSFYTFVWENDLRKSGMIKLFTGRFLKLRYDWFIENFKKIFFQGIAIFQENQNTFEYLCNTGRVRLKNNMKIKL